MPSPVCHGCLPSIWENPFTVADCREAGFRGTDAELVARRAGAFDAWIDSPYWRDNRDGHESEAAGKRIFDNLAALHLARCHADVLLRLANVSRRDYQR